MFLNLLNRLFRGGSQGRVSERSRARELGRAIELQKSGAVGPAEAILRQMLSSLPRDEDVLHLLGSLLIQQQRPAEAAAVLREVIALRPDSAEAHFNLGTACSALGQFEGAARYFVRAAALRPGFAEELLLRLVVFRLLMRAGGDNMSKIAFPMIKGYVGSLGPWFLIFGAFVIVAAGNCVNLTDGLDGLAIVPSMIAVGAFALFAAGFHLGNRNAKAIREHAHRFLETDLLL